MDAGNIAFMLICLKQAVKIRTGETGYDAIQTPNFDD